MQHRYSEWSRKVYAETKKQNKEQQIHDFADTTLHCNIILCPCLALAKDSFIIHSLILITIMYN